MKVYVIFKDRFNGSNQPHPTILEVLTDKELAEQKVNELTIKEKSRDITYHLEEHGVS